MGKYIKKSKIAGDLSVKDISHPTTLGFRTRSAAKNLPLHRLRSHSDKAESLNYLQPRSRRLVKLPLLSSTKKQQRLISVGHECQKRNSRAKNVPAEKKTVALVTTETEEDCGDNENTSRADRAFDLESGNRSIVRDSEAIRSEIEDFFAYAEQQQHRLFIQKYNFDIVSDNPLPGRYEWVKVMP
ncbi:PREDICTED: cyclin-dependent kinase inhibitor 5-like [Camelina sativa]|uniref:Cyclin-dependent kinase inhibitor 5-like n=1 Tax=Camelina sativa TaxID=90675 RepID=A0ABM0XNN1_CAMSA|nr:PREDICTED: cyclin-dependent kinase inhibitor 5-like [Camelina sativa]